MTGSARWAASHLRFAVASLALLAFSGAAHAGDGVQFDTLCDRTYVNKKVGDNEQWAITWEIYGDATGNVLKLDGSPPSFIECLLKDETDTEEIFDCYGADACNGPPCSGPQWTLIAEGIRILTSFFLPPGVDPRGPFGACEVN
jgi:hypothetical protein